MPRILVTGASGFLGSAVAAHLLAAGQTVRTTGRSSGPQRLPDYWPADLRHSTVLPDLLNGVDCVVHCAGLAHQFGDPANHSGPFQAINCDATERLARAASAQGVKRLVFVSSVSVYGPARASGLRDETEFPAPSGPYAESKRQAELGLLRIAADTGLQVWILRMATLYGEGDPGNVGRLMQVIDKGRFTWIGQGQNLKSLIHRDDAASACARAAIHSDQDRPVGIWNVSGPACSMKEIVNSMARALDRQPPRLSVPAMLASVTFRVGATLGVGPLSRRAALGLKVLQKWLADDAYDSRRFAEDFQWEALVSLEEGLKRQTQWYRATKDRPQKEQVAA